jgi:hypothetical protein
VSSEQKRAVVRAKNEVKRGGHDLAQVFAANNKEAEGNGRATVLQVRNHAQQPVPVSQNQQQRAKVDESRIIDSLSPESLPRRGFAQKMFSDMKVGDVIQYTPQDQVNGPMRSSPEFLSKGGLTYSPIEYKVMTPKKVTAYQEDSNNDLMLVSPTPPIRPCVYNWGSLGPPTELEGAALPGIRQRDAKEEKEEDLRWKTDALVPQLGRSIDLHYYDDKRADTAVDKNGRVTLSAAQMESINRINAWRMQTGATPTKVLYAPSASATEPSAFHRGHGRQGEDDELSLSHLTSISRRVHVGAEPKSSLDQEVLDDILRSCEEVREGGEGQVRIANIPEKLVDIASPPSSVKGARQAKAAKVLAAEESEGLFEVLE